MSKLVPATLGWLVLRNGMKAGPVPAETVNNWVLAGMLDAIVRVVPGGEWLAIPDSPFARAIPADWRQRFPKYDLNGWRAHAKHIESTDNIVERGAERIEARFAALAPHVDRETLARLRSEGPRIGDTELMALAVFGDAETVQEKVTSKATTRTLKWYDSYPRRLMVQVRLKNGKIDLVEKRD